MRKSIGVMALLALVLTGTAPALAKKDKRPLDAACDPLVQSTRRATSAAGLLIAGFDADGDAKTDHAELKAGTERMFRLADANHDGVLSLIELSDWAAVWLGGPSAIPGRFDFDRDQDDKVSRAEFAAELERRFNAFDADRNGIVDRAELLSAAIPKNCVDGRLVPQAPGQPDQR